jgi:ribonuclease HII
VIVSLSSEMISGNMLGRQPYSLNALSHDAAVRIVQHLLDAGVRVSHVYVDTVGDPGMYQAKLTRIFQDRIVFTVSKKADSLFKTVSAASIAAKVDRDKALVNWVYKEPVLREAMGAMRAAAASRGRVSSSASGTGCSNGSSSAVHVDEEDEMDPFGGAAPFSDDEDENEDSAITTSSKSKSSAGNSSSASSSSLSSSSTSAGKRSRSEISESATGASELSSSGGSGGTALYSSWILPVSAGSGYPGDARTKRWLRDSIDPIFGWPSIVRFSWSTCKELMDKECVAVQWEGELDEDEAAAEWRKPISGAAPLTNFFARVGGAPARSAFFKSRGFSHISYF